MCEPAPYVIVEANDSDHADLVAEQNGVYFEGVSKGMDCSCCGNRWDRNWEEGKAVPTIYGEEVSIDKLWISRQKVRNALDNKLVKVDHDGDSVLIIPLPAVQA